MKLILVPHSCTQSSVRIWMCATDTTSPPPDFSVSVKTKPDVLVNQKDWRPVEVGPLTVAESQSYIQVKTVSDLEPHTQYHVVSGPARASFSTLPSRLPRQGERPFSVLLASCFYVGNDSAPLVGAAIDGMKPDIKILCGDQVYLDVPEVTFLPMADNALCRLLLSKYLRNWNDETGYQVLLKTGASYFTADDHEFWNNHPNRALHIPNTWTESGRERLMGRALKLFECFQCDDPAKAGRPQGFDAGGLSFRIVDSRVFRQPGDDNFMDPADFTELTDWVSGLQHPGILVIGQPLFADPVGFLNRTFVDRVLPNYKQYETLVTAISRARASIVILTGDVHYSRIATATFRAGAAGPEVIEVISSPTAVVTGAPGKPAPPPDRFPAFPIKGIASAPATARVMGRSDNNFAMLEFTEASSQVNMRVQHFYIRGRGKSGLSTLPGPAMPEPGEAIEIPLFSNSRS